MSDKPNKLTIELKDVLSKALSDWSDKRYLKPDGSTQIPIKDMDGVMNGLINFLGLNMAILHSSALPLVTEDHAAFNYKMAHKYAEHFMSIFLDNMPEKK